MWGFGVLGIPIAYTVAVVKPHIALKWDKVAEVRKILEDNDFEIFDEKVKTLKNEEVDNLFFWLKKKEYYQMIK